MVNESRFAVRAVAVAASGAILCGLAVYYGWAETVGQTVLGADANPITYGRPRKLCELANVQIRESSGLAASRRRPGVFWTHNDSGDGPRIFALSLDGKDLGVYQVDGARSDDWEDMAAVKLDGRSCLLLADVGNNYAIRPQGTLYLVEEPVLDCSGPARLLQTVHFRFEDRPYDCEAIGFDSTRREVLLAVKQLALSTRIYMLRWPKPGSEVVLKAREIGRIAVPFVTAMDIAPDGRRAVVLTYGDAYEYRRGPREDWRGALSRPGRRIPMPVRRQGESICYGSDGFTLYLTSEQIPTPLFEVPAVSPK